MEEILDISDKNKIIAKWDLHIDSDNINYHKQWNNIMSVYRKIKNWYYDWYLGDKTQEEGKTVFYNIQYAILEADIFLVHSEIVEFIQWQTKSVTK